MILADVEHSAPYCSFSFKGKSHFESPGSLDQIVAST
jgi:hypothetical protein